MTPRLAKTRRASISEARAYLDKASEYLQASTVSLDLGNHVAATGNAVQTGMAAADAIAAVQAGEIWKGDHAQVATYLERTVRPDGQLAARHLRRLLPLRSTAEYDPEPISRPSAEVAVEAARRLVAIAEQVVESIGMPPTR